MDEAALQEKLEGLVRDTGWLMQALREVRALGLANWCIGAGTLRNLVWDAAHGYPRLPLGGSDVDVAWFDADPASFDRDAGLQAALAASLPELDWDVTNQAAVHTWFASVFGHEVLPLPDLHAAIASWPETATAVAVWLDEQDALHLIAPFGLADLFNLVVRRNPARVSVATYLQRIVSKRYTERWPDVRVLAP
ncbi:nucleotidyltransferase family protein [Chitinimonas naiadis]